MVTISEKTAQIARRLRGAGLIFGQGFSDAEQEADWIVSRVMERGRPEAMMGMEVEIDRLMDVRIESIVTDRIETRRPLAYLCREVRFGGLEFYIDERAIIPRSYLTEWLPERFEPWVQPDRIGSILDLCTGSGCIAVCCATYFETASVVASDISAEALAVAEKNITHYQLDRRIQLNQGDMFAGIEGRFDLIVCNPPYVSDKRMDTLPLEYQEEPELAFRGGHDGLVFIDRLFNEVTDYLTGHGSLILEVGSASSVLEAKYPDVPFTWLGTAYDERVIVQLSRDELVTYF